MEGAEPPPQALHETDHGRQGAEESCNRSGTRTVGLHLGHRQQDRAESHTTTGSVTRDARTKAKTLPKKEKAKLNNAIQLEDKVSRSRGKHEGEPSTEVCDRLSRTRVVSQRQLPTDLDYAVPTREYQLDQSSLIPASAAADPVLERKRRPAHLDRSLHITSELATNRPEPSFVTSPKPDDRDSGGPRASGK